MARGRSIELNEYILSGKPPPEKQEIRPFQRRPAKSKKRLRDFHKKKKPFSERFSFENLEKSFKAVGVVLGMSYEATDYLFPWWTDIYAGGINAGRKYVLKPKVSKIVPGPVNKVLVGTSREQMRREAAKRISETSNHPLRFLLDPETIGTKNPKFKRPPNRSHSTLIANPDVIEMGHIISDKAGGPEYLMLQNAWLNQFSNVTAEGLRRGGSNLGVFINNVAVDIGGIAVDLPTAQMWEELSLLAEGTVDAARRVQF